LGCICYLTSRHEYFSKFVRRVRKWEGWKKKISYKFYGLIYVYPLKCGRILIYPLWYIYIFWMTPYNVKISSFTPSLSMWFKIPSFPCNVREFWFTPSLNMSCHHLPLKHCRVIKKITGGKLKKKNITGGNRFFFTMGKTKHAYFAGEKTYLHYKKLYD
jgi:hypothetical protein